MRPVPGNGIDLDIGLLVHTRRGIARATETALIDNEATAERQTVDNGLAGMLRPGMRNIFDVEWDERLDPKVCIDLTTRTGVCGWSVKDAAYAGTCR